VVPGCSVPSARKLKLTLGVLTVPSGPEVIFTVRLFVPVVALAPAGTIASASSAIAAAQIPLHPLGIAPMLERRATTVKQVMSRACPRRGAPAAPGRHGASGVLR
jgi:hypothetical protein